MLRTLRLFTGLLSAVLDCSRLVGTELSRFPGQKGIRRDIEWNSHWRDIGITIETLELQNGTELQND